MIPAVQLPTCTKCKTWVPIQALEAGDFAECSGCGGEVKVEIFPAYFKPVNRGQGGETIVVDGEASCFFHPNKRAQVSCESCGRFLCALCAIELNGKNLCPNCLESGQKKGKFVELENRRACHNNAALSLALVPLILCWFTTVVTAPIALFYALWYWKSPGSIIPHSKARLVIAIVISSLIIIGWVIAFSTQQFRNIF